MRRSSVLSWSAAVFAVSGVFVSPLLAQPACESAKLLALDGASGDDFGASVAVSGSFAVVGAPEDDDAGSSSGAAYVFSFDGS
ncbi:MAG: FG-GAP repeat protein, partial [Planctomycetota bacterium]